jgi:hypothetical protein
MSLRRRERVMLRLAEQAIVEGDARLAGVFAVFNSLAVGEAMPAAERVRRAGMRPRADERSFALVIAVLVAMLLAGSAVLGAGGPACGRGAAAVTRGCPIPGAGPALVRELPAAGRAQSAAGADRPGHRS